MHRLPFFSHGRDRRLEVVSESGREPVGRAARPQALLPALAAVLRERPGHFASRFAGFPEIPLAVTPGRGGEPAAIPTETLVVEGGRSAEIRWACRKLSLEVVAEGSHGRVLLRSVCDARGTDRLRHTADAALRLRKRGHVAVAHTNLLRLHRQPAPSPGAGDGRWALSNPGDPGLPGADVAAEAAWTLTRGRREVRVAVLDDGVASAHPYLAHAIAAERDFRGEKATARPDGDDAHGTACAGIIAAQGPRAGGLAPGVSLVSARIAEGGGHGFWITDDFDTAEAIDWCSGEAGAGILNLSWGGGPPADVISRALTRAARAGRDGLGCVIVAAAGNNQTVLDYPADLPDVLAVGASNQWDERKTRRSRDGEDWWGSNFGDNLSLLAPGVSILTTDLPGRRGSSPTLVEPGFNGTSAAAPFVAATAALMLSLRPRLAAGQVRRVLERTAEPLSGGTRRTVGHGRVQAYAALRDVQRSLRP